MIYLHACTVCGRAPQCLRAQGWLWAHGSLAICHVGDALQIASSRFEGNTALVRGGVVAIEMDISYDAVVQVCHACQRHDAFKCNSGARAAASPWHGDARWRPEHAWEASLVTNRR